MPNLRLTIIFSLGILFLSKGLSATQSWTVSNDPALPGDFSSVAEAFSHPTFADGDALLLQPSSTAYPMPDIDRPVRIVAHADQVSSEAVVKVEGLYLAEGVPGEVFLSGLTIHELTVSRDNVRIEQSILHGLTIEDAGGFSITRSLISIQPEQHVLIREAAVEFFNNLILFPKEGGLFSADAFSLLELHHNTIIDPAGLSEWVSHKGTFHQNILMLEGARFATFATERTGNIIATFPGPPASPDTMPADELFQLGTGSLADWLPHPAGPASGAAPDGTDIGFTGGETPLRLNELPGLQAIFDTLPAPNVVLASAEAAQLLWSWEAVGDSDGLHLQWREAGSAWSDTLLLSPDTTAYLLDNLIPSTAYEIRLRSFNGGLASAWASAEGSTTEAPYDALAFYQDTVDPLTSETNGWFRSSWFGWFQGVEPGLIHHTAHGFLQPVGEPASLYLYDLQLGLWIWTNDLLYPNLYAFPEPLGWLLFNPDTATPDRSFYQYATGTWLHESEL